MINSVNSCHSVTSNGKTLVSICGRVVFATCMTLSILHQAQAASISANSVSFIDITSAIALASDGDTVVVPAGIANWTSILVITKGITLQGAGSEATVIIDNVPRTSANQGGSIIAIAATPNRSFRLTGFTFRPGLLTTTGNGTIRLSGTCPSVRVDHCHFDQLNIDNNIQIFGWLYGVIDHCTFDISNQGSNSVYVSHANWGGVDTHGHQSWADPPQFGSEKFIFIEDNVINNHTTAPNSGTMDMQRGGRMVVRHNAFSNMNIFYHGTDSGSGGVYYRGARCAEIYNNTFTSSIQIPGGYTRGGSLLWHDNTYTTTGTGAIGGMSMKIFRLSQGGQAAIGDFGVANGNSPWDKNDPHGLYLSGKHTGANHATTLTVSGAGWTADQWAGYSVTNTGPTSPYTGFASYIVSNTSDTLTYVSGAVPSTNVKFNTGDGFAIYKVLFVLDQPCRGQGDYIGPSDTPTPAWPHQALEPCYSWNNTLNGSNLNLRDDDTVNVLRENIDFFNNTPMPGYTPYPYPHPLVNDRPAPPTNLRVL